MRLPTVGLAVLVLALAVHDSSPHPHGRQEGRGRQGEESGRRLYQEGDPKLCLLTNTTDQKALCTLQGCPEDTDCVKFSSPSSDPLAFYGYQDLEVRLCLKRCNDKYTTSGCPSGTACQQLPNDLQWRCLPSNSAILRPEPLRHNARMINQCKIKLRDIEEELDKGQGRRGPCRGRGHGRRGRGHRGRGRKGHGRRGKGHGRRGRRGPHPEICMLQNATSGKELCPSNQTCPTNTDCVLYTHHPANRTSPQHHGPPPDVVAFFESIHIYKCLQGCTRDNTCPKGLKCREASKAAGLRCLPEYRWQKRQHNSASSSEESDPGLSESEEPELSELHGSRSKSSRSDSHEFNIVRSSESRDSGSNSSESNSNSHESDYFDNPIIESSKLLSEPPGSKSNSSRSNSHEFDVVISPESHGIGSNPPEANSNSDESDYFDNPIIESSKLLSEPLGSNSNSSRSSSHEFNIVRSFGSHGSGANPPGANSNSQETEYFDSSIIESSELLSESNSSRSNSHEFDIARSSESHGLGSNSSESNSNSHESHPLIESSELQDSSSQESSSQESSSEESSSQESSSEESSSESGSSEEDKNVCEMQLFKMLHEMFARHHPQPHRKGRGGRGRDRDRSHFVRRPKVCLVVNTTTNKELCNNKTACPTNSECVLHSPTHALPLRLGDIQKHVCLQSCINSRCPRGSKCKALQPDSKRWCIPKMSNREHPRPLRSRSDERRDDEPCSSESSSSESSSEESSEEEDGGTCDSFLEELMERSDGGSHSKERPEGRGQGHDRGQGQVEG